MDTKVCTVCQKSLPATLEYFYPCPVVKCGLTSRCIACSKQYTKDHYEESKKWREENKELLKQKKHEYYEKTKDKHKQQGKEWRRNNIERVRELSNLWKKNNPDKMRVISHNRYEKVKEHHKVITRQWKQAHKEERNIAWQARRAKKLQLDNTLTTEQWEQIKSYFNNKCCYCGKEAKLTQDHFIPLSKDGEYTHNNIVPCCLSCNSSKNEKDFFEWYPIYRHYSKRREQKLLKFLGYKDGIQQIELVETKLYCITN
jgi:hypothetical protein